MMIAAGKKMRNRYENNGSQRRGSKRVKKSTAENSEFHKDPSADVRTNQAEHNVRDASKSASTRNFSCEPSRNQTEEQPRNEAVRLEPDSKTLLKKQVCGEHEPSKANTDCS